MRYLISNSLYTFRIWHHCAHWTSNATWNFHWHWHIVTITMHFYGNDNEKFNLSKKTAISFDSGICFRLHLSKCDGCIRTEAKYKRLLYFTDCRADCKIVFVIPHLWDLKKKWSPPPRLYLRNIQTPVVLTLKYFLAPGLFKHYNPSQKPSPKGFLRPDMIWNLMNKLVASLLPILSTKFQK